VKLGIISVNLSTSVPSRLKQTKEYKKMKFIENHRTENIYNKDNSIHL
jgi:hypothetical protein